VERLGGKIRGVGVHMAQKEEPGFLLGSKAFELGNRDGIEVFGLMRASVLPGAPALELQIFLEAAGGGVGGEADAGSVVAVLAQNLGEGGDIVGQAALMPQCDNGGAEAVAAGQHGGIAGRRRDMRRQALGERNAALEVFVDVRRSQALVAVERHMIRAHGVDAEEQQVGFLCHRCDLLYVLYVDPVCLQGTWMRNLCCRGAG